MTLRVEYDQETGENKFFADPEDHVVFTGPHITGHVVVDDGTRYNVTPLVILAQSLEHAQQIAEGIGKRFELEGHPLYTEDVPFKFVSAVEQAAKAPVVEAPAEDKVVE